ncbi:hypothetical protein FKW77_003396 [Venturia effusa]|uniref:Mediator of RNA polymerase II transcription subunit 7 n=1 Tax=Venturia effusa TaxID=50376 RepID=A0A517L8Y1_9PEZI|nr:hypothetical protein FKW77_003396 [Venturia effusa]
MVDEAHDEDEVQEEDEQPEALYENFQLPRPPPFYRQFTEKNLQRLKDLKDVHGHDLEDAKIKGSILLDLPPELRCLVPPEPPENGVVRNFGDFKTNLDFLKPLSDMDIPQLYPDPIPLTADESQWTHERARYLKQLARSILLSFIELMGILSVNPNLYRQKVEHLQRLFENALHLINEYRPHQARESLILMMEKQIQKKRDEIDKVKSMKEKVDTLLTGLGKEELDGTPDTLLSNEGSIAISAAELWKREQRAVWNALDEELGQLLYSTKYNLYINKMATQSTNKSKKLAVLCDGTWCGRETGTTTNISILASKIGIDMTPALNRRTAADPIPALEIDNSSRKVKARYFDGCGLGDTFLAYLFNGATGSDIGKECLEAYQYIVDHFDDETEIWMFGHSRGSFTVRCVAGMINNCGIIKKRDTAEATKSLCYEVYQMYRSRDEEDLPSSAKMIQFREKASWNLNDATGKRVSPIKFMGIVDTVGSLGIPRINAGIGLDYPEFYDQNVSAEVEKVYHAMSMHDRLWAFAPCRAKRDPKKHYERTRPDLSINEKWFPGCHYDVGRQRFNFFRTSGNIVEKTLFKIPSLLTKSVEPNEICADLVLLYILEGIQKEDVHQSLIPHLNDELTTLKNDLATNTTPNLGSGDIYGHIPSFAPAAGGFVSTALTTTIDLTIKTANFFTPTLKLGTAVQDMLGIRTITDILLATRDRRIPSAQAVVVELAGAEPLFGSVSVRERAGLQEGRYPSRTFENWLGYLLAVEVIDWRNWVVRTGGAEEG